LKKLKIKKTVNIQEYRLITGACLEGCKRFLNEINIKGDTVDLDVAIDNLSEQYGGEKFINLFS